MGKDQSKSSAAVGAAQGEPEAIRGEIVQTRAELGDTVEALAAKTDVKARARQKADDVKRTAAERKDEVFAKARDVGPASATSGAQAAGTKVRENPVPVAVVGGFVAGFIAGKLSDRR
jgi:hypothetical protein